MISLDCPTCKTPQDGAMQVGGSMPVPPSDGDVIVCWDCLSIGVMDGDRVRVPTMDEQMEFGMDTQLQHVIAEARRFKSEFGR